MTCLLRNIVKAYELLSMTPFRRALDLPAVGAEGWVLPPLPHQMARTAEPGTVRPAFPGDTEVLQTCCKCALVCPLPVAWERWCSYLGWWGNQRQDGWAHYGDSSFFPATISPKERGSSLALDGCVASHSEEKGPLKEMATVGTGVAHPGCQELLRRKSYQGW